MGVGDGWAMGAALADTSLEGAGEGGRAFRRRGRHRCAGGGLHRLWNESDQDGDVQPLFKIAALDKFNQRFLAGGDFILGRRRNDIRILCIRDDVAIGGDLPLLLWILT